MWRVRTSLKEIVATSKRSRAPETKAVPANPAELPAEILLLIGNELLRDPGATLVDFKHLRLVCRVFDRVFASIVLSSIHAFYTSPKGKVLARCHQLQALTTGYDRLAYVEELILHSWDWVFHSFSTPSSKSSGLKEVVKSKVWNFVLVPAGYVLWTLYIDPTAVGRQVRKRLARAQAKKVVKQIEDVSFQLPNVRRVSWWHSKLYPDSLQSVLLNLNILENLPSLTELELSLDSSHDGLEQIAISLSRLRNLQKIVIHIDTTGTKSHELLLKCLKQVIAHNHNLTYLEVYLSNPYDEPQVTLPDLFNETSPDTPLKLKHLRLAPYFYQITPAMRPHMHCLTSLDICFPVYWDSHPMDTIWQVLHEEGIQVSEIQTNRITDDMLHYLQHLRTLESLSVYDTPMIGQERNREPGKSLFLALARHANTLRRLKLEPYNWGYWYQDPEAQAALLRCTKLEELVLHQGSGPSLRVTVHDIIAIARVISQIEWPVTFILEGEPMLHTWFVQSCRRSSDPTLKDLISRIVYQQSKW
ncbi:hypothetical protein M378DRAFT_163413 [Amanita muscaria Koide BX008]|uniref:Uncharacterized protein n=1 Tax=Amanita muscaria (strain Koide BX008) TaxID=946122 RepID=A0A0C2WRS6_AMAMK|nr:hypothetical protein M378DRAFT_163413 [Amanita muscaria Koide BX008]